MLLNSSIGSIDVNSFSSLPHIVVVSDFYHANLTVELRYVV